MEQASLHRGQRALALAAVALAAFAALFTFTRSAFAITDNGGALRLANLDARAGTVLPTAAQVAAANALNAHATWNRFGTPQSLINYNGYLATGVSGDAVTVAKSFISGNAGLFRLSPAGVANLQLLNDSPMTGSPGHAVIFRQTFGGLSATEDGMITVGVVGDKVAYVSSSSAGDGAAPAAATLSPAAAWTIAAQNAGFNVALPNVLWSKVDRTTGWTGLQVGALRDLQRVRLTAFPTYTQGIRAAYEAIVVDTSGSATVGYRDFVDARTGEVLFRYDGVQNAADTGRAVSRPSAGTGTRIAADTVQCDPTATACVFAGTFPVTGTTIS